MALNLAQRGWYTARPNPRVGCVLVRGGTVVGSGWHQRTGEAHAEIMALACANDRAQNATAYISLEPCAHHGRTPPCCEALVKAGVSRVVVATGDPNPKVAGKGIQILRAAGIEVTENVLAKEAQLINAGFMQRQRTGMPRVVLKMAMSMDGRIAMASGESRWISCADSRSQTQDMRAASCGVLTGIGTVLADNPRLTVRSNDWYPVYEFMEREPPQPLVIVVDSKLRLPKKAQVRQLGQKLLIAHCTSRDAQDDCLLWRAPEKTGKVDLQALFKYLGEDMQLNNILVECGGVLASSLVAHDLIDEFCFYIAPIFLGTNTLPAIDFSIERIQKALNLRIVEQLMVGTDVRVRAVPANRL